jgi:hypothetical protein
MRYIDTSHIVVPSNWTDLARQVKKSDGRTRKFSEGALWSYFREDFEDIVGKKCWYSESSNDGSSNPIDHFRPKADNVKAIPLYSSISSLASQLDLAQGIGYKFLKFEFSNYRYSCDIVNSPHTEITVDKTTRGKWDFFPIRSGSTRALSLANIPNEIHCLLDPCVQNDVEMLTFNNLGFIEPHISILNTSWEYCRVKVSIELYHLDYSVFVEGRKEVWGFCEDRIDILNNCMQKRIRSEQLSEIETKSMIQARKDLDKSINKKSKFSAVAIDCIHYHQNTYTWLKILFPDIKK